MRWFFKRFFKDSEADFPGAKEFEKKIAYKFKDKSLLKIALSHRSYIHSQKLDHIKLSNERLEFLGDAVLDLVITEYFFNKYPGKKEGQLSKLKSLVVSSQVLARCGKIWNLGDYILLSHSEKKAGGGKRVSILADAFEAVLGAVYLDGGLNAAKQVILGSVVLIIDEVTSDQELHNYKSELLELIQSDGLNAPQYELRDESGPEHKKSFTVAVMVENQQKGLGTGMSKKAAEQSAARDALKILKKLDTLDE